MHFPMCGTSSTCAAYLCRWGAFWCAWHSYSKIRKKKRPPKNCVKKHDIRVKPRNASSAGDVSLVSLAFRSPRYLTFGCSHLENCARSFSFRGQPRGFQSKRETASSVLFPALVPLALFSVLVTLSRPNLTSLAVVSD